MPVSQVDDTEDTSQETTKRQFVVVPHLSLVKVKLDGGGKIPAALSGMYTSTKLALAAIEAYEKANRKPTKSRGTKRGQNSKAKASS